MVAAVNHLHQNSIIHRDVKLENFLIDQDRSQKNMIIVKLIDFGLAVFYDRNNKPSKKCGTLYAMAPEIFTQKTYDEKVDCWALGIVLFQLLTNRRPFVFINKEDLREQIVQKKLNFSEYPDLMRASSAARDLLSKLLVRDP